MTVLGKMREREAELWRRYPAIDWLRPQKVVVPREDGVIVERMTCRFCTALNGLAAVNLEAEGFLTISEFQRHQEREHFDG